MSSPIEPPSETSLPVNCEGCGEDRWPLDPVEVDGRLWMVCERCYREVADG